jgi:hypothetical protein
MVLVARSASKLKSLKPLHPSNGSKPNCSFGRALVCNGFLLQDGALNESKSGQDRDSGASGAGQCGTSIKKLEMRGGVGLTVTSVLSGLPDLAGTLGHF